MADVLKKKIKSHLTKIRAFGMIDTMTSHTLVGLLDKPPDRRTKIEIEFFLPSIKMSANCLKNVHKDVAAKILKFSKHRQYQKGEVIVTQGDIGNEFFVIIRGSVAVYVREEKQKAKKSITVKLPSIRSSIHTVSRPSVGEVKVEEKTQGHDESSRDPLREKYGERVNVLGPGFSFGELALLRSKSKRNATIIAEETPTDLMVVDRDLFEHTIKEFQNQELLNKKLFIKTHPFFVKWSEPQQEQLLAVLKKTAYHGGQCPLRQGERMEGVHFLVKGKAKLTVDPERHKKQYPHLFKEILPLEFREFGGRKSDSSRVPVSDLTYIRQAEGYAAAEKFLARRKVEVCSVEAGEVLGDVEYILGLNSYIYRMYCTSNCVIYSIDMKQLERLFCKKNPQVLKLLKSRAETKLIGRMTSLPGRKIQLFPLLSMQLRFVRIIKDEESGDGVTIQRESMAEIKRITGHDGKIETEMKPESETVTRGHVPKHVIQGPEYHRQHMRKQMQARKEMFEKYQGDQEALCRSLSKNMREMIVNNVKQRVQVENMIKKHSLSWANENTWLTRWK